MDNELCTMFSSSQKKSSIYRCHVVAERSRGPSKCTGLDGSETEVEWMPSEEGSLDPSLAGQGACVLEHDVH